MSFKNIKDVLSRDEMKSIAAGSGGGGNSCRMCCSHGYSICVEWITSCCYIALNGTIYCC